MEACENAQGLWEPDRKWTGGWGIAGQQYGQISCATCHVKGGGSGNIKRLRETVTAPDGSFFPLGNETVIAREAVPGLSSDFGDDSGGGHANSQRVCEICHSKTYYHRFDTSAQVAEGGSLGHFNASDCVSCHKHRQGFRAGCSDCHGNSDTGAAWPDGTDNNINRLYSAADDDTLSHERHVVAIGTGNDSCASCHPLPAPTATTHINGTPDLTQTGFSYASGTCSNISCHSGSNATWGASACIGCHATAQGSRAAITGQFSANSHHVQGVEISDSHCYQCHWEANLDGTINGAYHGRNSTAAVDLVVYGAGTRPLTYIAGSTAVQYAANGTRTEIAKLDQHCLGCHGDANNFATPFGDGKTPKQYAWDGTSIASRYSQAGTTPWGKYSGTNITPKAPRTKAYSAHGNAVNNQGGWDLSETWPDKRTGTANVGCFDCHNSHGSTVAGRTVSYAASGGGILKATTTGIGGYAVSYAPQAGGTTENKNQRNPGASLCFDCHLTASGGTTTPWGYQSSFGATQAILGYFDTAHFAPGNSGQQQRLSFKQSAVSHGGHFGASTPLKSAATGSINGLCTPCHDPHGVSTTLSQAYAVPLLKGTWMTSPYREDLPPMYNQMYTNRTHLGYEGVHYRVDENTFGANIYSLVTGISETDAQFAGLCLQCHPKERLTDGVTHTWKSKDRVHESVKGWKTTGTAVKHRYTCSKCHAPHVASGLPRLMVTNCLDSGHKGRARLVDPVDAGTYGRIPGSFYDWWNGVNGQIACHEGPNGNADYSRDQRWNSVTPWQPPLTITAGPAAGAFADAADPYVRADITWTTSIISNSYVDYGLSTAYGKTAGNTSLVTGHSITLSSLTNHSTYYYRVRSYSPNNLQSVSAESSFYISVPPTVPVLVAEPDAVCASNCPTTFAWGASTDPDGGSIEYEVQVSTQSNFGTLAASSGWIAGTNWSVDLTATNTTYYWRVRSRDAGHTTAQDPPSAWSAADRFLTSDGNITITELVSPANGTIGSCYDSWYSVNFQWEGYSGTQYRVVVSTSSTFSSLTNDSGWIAAKSWSTVLTPPALSTTTYYWKVQGLNGDGSGGPWSATWSLTVTDLGTGSCPFLFTWDGEKFVFEADMYLTGKLATKTSSGYLKPEPNDYYLLKATPTLKDGYYDLRLVEERYEANYLDKLQLYAIDAPADRQVFAELPEMNGLNPLPDVASALHTILREAPTPVRTIHVNTGEDVTEKIAADDGLYLILNEDQNVDFTYQTLELDLGEIGAAPQIKVVMDAMSMFPDTPEGVERARSFGARTILEVQDGTGAWITVPFAQGYLPKPPEFSRPYVFDITDIWASASRKVRFTFLFKTYVDWIRVDTTADVPVTIAEVPMASAELRLHGFNAKSSNDEIYSYIYSEPNGLSAYLPGNYTRFGDVGPLLTALDDRFVIYGGGDEIAMTFRPAAPPEAGMERSFLLYTNGYYKDMKVDVPHTVEPLPFAGMSNFPYDPAVENYPDDPPHRQYRLEYNTRVYP